jgi:hypothetical protein
MKQFPKLKNSMNEMKNIQNRSSTPELIKQKKESVILKTYYLKIYNLRGKKSLTVTYHIAE